DGEPAPGGPPAICTDVHHRQAPYRGSVAVTGDAATAESHRAGARHAARPAMSARCPTPSLTMTIRALAGAVIALFFLSASVSPSAAQHAEPPIVSVHDAVPVAADTSTSQFSVDGVNVILRRNTANDVIAAN